MMWLRKLFPLCKAQTLAVNQSLSVRQFSKKTPLYSYSGIFSSLKEKFRSLIQTRKEPIIGIDLGTTKSRVAVFEGDVVKVLENKEVPRETPSLVTVTDKGKSMVDHQMKLQPLINPNYTMFSTKRLLREWQVQTDYHSCKVPFTVNEYLFNKGPITKELASTDEAISYILGKLKSSAEDYLKTPVYSAAISYPHLTTDSEVIRSAARNVGFKYVETMPETAALGLASRYSDPKSMDKLVAIYAFSGGRFEITIAQGLGSTMDSTAMSLESLSGDNFDYGLSKLVRDKLLDQTGVDCGNHKLVMSILREAAVEAKIQLSQATEVEIVTPLHKFFSDGSDEPVTVKLTKEEFENFAHNRIEKTFSLCTETIKEAGVNLRDIDEVLLVGGMTKIPKVRKMVEEFFEQRPSDRLDPDEAAAVGAALYSRRNSF